MKVSLSFLNTFDGYVNNISKKFYFVISRNFKSFTLLLPVKYIIGIHRNRSGF